MPNLLAFLHVSTYYTCNHLPRNSTVAEQLYPLQLSLDGGASKVGHAESVAALMAMTPDEANVLAGMVMQANSFGSSYAFGKSLTEQLVADTALRPGAAKAIVRPALISNLAGSPYPGFVQGYAGPGGYIMGELPDDVQLQLCSCTCASLADVMLLYCSQASTVGKIATVLVGPVAI
jgi:fatty acyl-CoA reductase